MGDQSGSDQNATQEIFQPLPPRILESWASLRSLKLQFGEVQLHAMRSHWDSFSTFLSATTGLECLNLSGTGYKDSVDNGQNLVCIGEALGCGRLKMLELHDLAASPEQYITLLESQRHSLRRLDLRSIGLMDERQDECWEHLLRWIRGQLTLDRVHVDDLRVMRGAWWMYFHFPDGEEEHKFAFSFKGIVKVQSGLLKLTEYARRGCYYYVCVLQSCANLALSGQYPAPSATG